MTLSDFLRRFKYRSDGKTDCWTILTAPTGPLRGDCEDFALTVLYILAGHSRAEMRAMVRRGEAYLWLTHTPAGVSHMMLWVQDSGWIDNTHPRWSETPHYPPEKRIEFAKFVARLAWKGAIWPAVKRLWKGQGSE